MKEYIELAIWHDGTLLCIQPTGPAPARGERTYRVWPAARPWRVQTRTSSEIRLLVSGGAMKSLKVLCREAAEATRSRYEHRRVYPKAA